MIIPKPTHSIESGPPQKRHPGPPRPSATPQPSSGPPVTPQAPYSRSPEPLDPRTARLENGTMSAKEGTHSPLGDDKNFLRTPTSWDAQDDILLMHLKDQQKLGWKEIASHFTNRTPNACQFRWRRLKLGNLKNPPKLGLGQALPTRLPPAPKKAPRKPKVDDQPFPYLPIANATFTGYDTHISTALAGLNALSNTPLNILSPVPNYQLLNTNPSTPQLHLPHPPPNVNTTNHPQHFDHLPDLEVLLDPQLHGAGAGGGYYADILIDPTMNLPHHQPNPHPASSLTPRNSQSGPTRGSHLGQLLHSNLIIQIVRDDRTLVSLSRALVSLLPSKLMNIPHHQTTSLALAHLPILFGAGSSILGPSRNLSVSAHPTTVQSVRNGSIVGPPGLLTGYYSRLGSVVIPHTADKKDEDLLRPESRPAPVPASRNGSHKKEPLLNGTPSAPSAGPIFKIPWSMEEDELLINRRNRELSFAELSILLPQRTEGEIWSRIDHLEKLRNGHRSSSNRDNRRRRQSSIGLDDVDDFYDDVIGGIDVSDDDDDDNENVLVDVDDSLPRRKAKRRRASSAINPLTVGSVKKKLR